MNYDQARQIKASGKWNWTTMNDGVIRTARPCAYPDFEWPAQFDVLNPPTPTGRERCDHETREEAERHYWLDNLSRVDLQPLDLSTIRERYRCAVRNCDAWEDYRARHPGGYIHDSLCQRHATAKTITELHPFHPGTQVIHS